MIYRLNLNLSLYIKRRIILLFLQVLQGTGLRSHIWGPTLGAPDLTELELRPLFHDI